MSGYELFLRWLPDKMLFQQGLKAATCPLYSMGETGLFQPFVVVKIKVLLTHLPPSRATFELRRFGNELSWLPLRHKSALAAESCNLCKVRAALLFSAFIRFSAIPKSCGMLLISFLTQRYVSLM